MKHLVSCVLVSCLAFCSQASGQSGIITISNPLASPPQETVTVSPSLNGAGLSVTPSAQNFQIPQGAPAQSQSLQIGGIAGAAWQATASTSTGGPWLSVSPATGQIPASLTALVNPGSLLPGTYQGSITIQAPGTTPASIAISVTLTVTGTTTYTISTFAGGGLPTNVPGTSVGLDNPSSLAVDQAGNVFFTFSEDCVCLSGILRLDATTGILTVVAGSGTPGFGGDNGPATSALLNHPAGLTVDAAGNLYIADSGNNRIRMVSNGVITTVAGNGTQGFSGDNGPATSATVNSLSGLTVDSAGNLYIADSGNNRIRMVSNGVITTVAGSVTQGFNGDNGPATSAMLNGPGGVAVDSAGNLYIADSGNNRIRKVSNGVITTLAGNGTDGFSGDNGPATSAMLNGPGGVAVDSAGNLYIADSGNNRIRMVSNGVITTVAGDGTFSFSGDNGPAISAQLDYPVGVAVDITGDLYIADYDNDSIRKVSNGIITTVAGDGTFSFSGDNGPATSAQLALPSNVAVDSAGNLYIADIGNNRIRKVSNGVITTVAGNGTLGFSGDNGSAISAGLDGPGGVALDSAGNLYIADGARIREVSNGVITTLAGEGTYGFSGDNGPATSAQLQPAGLAVDSAGNLYIADSGNNRIRMVSNGVITTVAGNGTDGFSGDNGPATSAQLSQPCCIAVDSAGNLYIADGGEDGGGRIRMVSNGVITTVAGNGTDGFSGDNGPAISAQFHFSESQQSGMLSVGSAGNVYIADFQNQRIRLLTPDITPTN